MANQTELLNISDEMKLNDNVQPDDVKEQEENLYSSSLDTLEELCSSSVPDTCGNGVFDGKASPINQRFQQFGEKKDCSKFGSMGYTVVLFRRGYRYVFVNKRTEATDT